MDSIATVPVMFVPPYVPEDLAEKFSVMKRQETTSYRIYDYLQPGYVGGGILVDGDNETTSGKGWRARMCEWSYQVIDSLDKDREIVSVSMNCFDRCLCRRPVNKTTFQLLAVTTLYLASKVCHQALPSLSELVSLGRGLFTEDDVMAMEKQILEQLSWQVRPPTPLSFANHLVLLLKPAAFTLRAWRDVMDTTRFLTELAQIDYDFAPMKPSSVGLAALMTAIDIVDRSNDDSSHLLSGADRRAFLQNIYNVAEIAPNDPEATACRIRLHRMYSSNLQGNQQLQQNQRERMEQVWQVSVLERNAYRIMEDLARIRENSVRIMEDSARIMEDSARIREDSVRIMRHVRPGDPLLVRLLFNHHKIARKQRNNFRDTAYAAENLIGDEDGGAKYQPAHFPPDVIGQVATFAAVGVDLQNICSAVGPKDSLIIRTVYLSDNDTYLTTAVRAFFKTSSVNFTGEKDEARERCKQQVLEWMKVNNWKKRVTDEKIQNYKDLLVPYSNMSIFPVATTRRSLDPDQIFNNPIAAVELGLFEALRYLVEDRHIDTSIYKWQGICLANLSHIWKPTTR